MGYTYSLCRYNPGLRNNIEILGTEVYRVSKPTILCPGGTGVTRLTQAGKLTELAVNLIGLKSEKDDIVYGNLKSVDVVGICYGESDDDFEGGYMSNHEIKEFCDKSILPLVVDKDGNRLPLDMAKKNMSLITFFCHCYGADVVQNILVELSIKLGCMGYSMDEVHDILGQVQAISFAPKSSIYCGGHMKIHSVKDYVIIPKKPAPKGLNGIEIEKEEGNEFVVWSSMLANEKEVDGFNEHAIGSIRRNDQWELKANMRGDQVYIGKNADTVSQMVAVTLAQMVLSSMTNHYSDTWSPRPSVDTLISNARDILTSVPSNDLTFDK